MGFRGKAQADEHRIDALEDDLNAKDAQIARLEAERAAEVAKLKADLAEARELKGSKRTKGRSSSAPKNGSGLNLPDKDLWELTLKELSWSGFAGIMGVCGTMGGVALYDGAKDGDHAGVIFGAVILTFGLVAGFGKQRRLGRRIAAFMGIGFEEGNV